MRILQRLAVYPIAFAAYFVLFLYAENLELVRPSEVVAPLGWAVGASGSLVVVTALVLRSWVRGALVAVAMVVAFFGYGHVKALAGVGLPDVLLVGGWGLFVLAAVACALYGRTPLAALTGGLNVTVTVLLVFALASIVPHLVQSPARANASAFTPTGLVAERTTTRDIFYLVFDRYGSQSSLEAEFGITDNDLPDWLAGRGFTVVPDAHANYVRTTLSLAAVLNLDYLDSVGGMSADSTDHGPIHRMLHEQLVGRFLREQGYRYIHIGSWFNPTRTIRVADESLQLDIATEFETVLHATTAMPLIHQILPRGAETMPDHDRSHREHALFQLRTLNRLLADPGPKFVFAHVLLPHDPYVFDEDGGLVLPSQREGKTRAELFRQQLEFTNRQVKSYVEQLLSAPESERPIIIIQADEGPYPARYERDQHGFDWSTATPHELEAKFGIINAFYLPPEADEPAELPAPYPTMSSVNTFRLVLARYFGLDLPLLPDRSYTSRSPRHVYDMTDITDRLLRQP